MRISSGVDAVMPRSLRRLIAASRTKTSKTGAMAKRKRGEMAAGSTSKAKQANNREEGTNTVTYYSA
jgi:hypothetical protein